jgi:hypothetical protein
MHTQPMPIFSKVGFSPVAWSNSEAEGKNRESELQSEAFTNKSKG